MEGALASRSRTQRSSTRAVRRWACVRPECLQFGDLFPVGYVGDTAAGLGAALLDPLEIHVTRAVTVRELRELERWLGTPA